MVKVSHKVLLHPIATDFLISLTDAFRNKFGIVSIKEPTTPQARCNTTLENIIAGFQMYEYQTSTT